jgi:hypothetical protein
MSKTHSNYWYQLSCTIMVFCSISIQYALSFTYLRSFGWRACCGLEEAETCRTRSKPTGNCKDRLILYVRHHLPPSFSFFERLRPAADSALLLCPFRIPIPSSNLKSTVIFHFRYVKFCPDWFSSQWDIDSVFCSTLYDGGHLTLLCLSESASVCLSACVSVSSCHGLI